MTAPTSQITLGGVGLDGLATLGLRIDYQAVGNTYLQLADGSTVHQNFFEKQQITFTCSGWAPSGVRALSRSTSHALVVPDPEEVGGTRSYTVWIIDLRETHDVNRASASWTMVCREA